MSYVYGNSSALCEISSADLLTQENFFKDTYCLLLNLPLSIVKSLSVMPPGSPKSLWAFFWVKTCPEPAIKTQLWHHRGKSCWHSYHMVSVDAASEGMSTPTWPMVWQDPACRRVQSTLIKSVALQKRLQRQQQQQPLGVTGKWQTKKTDARKTVCTKTL